MVFLEELTGAMAIKLQNEFPDIAVYTEGVYMNCEKPCFFVECEKAEKVSMLMEKYIMRYSMCVTYENDTDTKNRDHAYVMEQLFKNMAWVNISGTFVRGRGLSGRIEGGKLVMRGTYDVFIIEKDADREMMGEMRDIYMTCREGE